VEKSLWGRRFWGEEWVRFDEDLGIVSWGSEISKHELWWDSVEKRSHHRLLLREKVGNQRHAWNRHKVQWEGEARAVAWIWTECPPGCIG
jgi:hypothetical protein